MRPVMHPDFCAGFQHTAARRRLHFNLAGGCTLGEVSTHSRPKAAAKRSAMPKTPKARFNTQPPEGGCKMSFGFTSFTVCFNTQPPEGGCIFCYFRRGCVLRVSTHSRPKAAATSISLQRTPPSRFNTQPPEGGCKQMEKLELNFHLFQHTAARRRLPCSDIQSFHFISVSTHSRPKAAAYIALNMLNCLNRFQHTAARRRLLPI